jgi:hypothetical protein
VSLSWRRRRGSDGVGCSRWCRRRHNRAARNNGVGLSWRRRRRNDLAAGHRWRGSRVGRDNRSNLAAGDHWCGSRVGRDNRSNNLAAGLDHGAGLDLSASLDLSAGLDLARRLGWHGVHCCGLGWRGRSLGVRRTRCGGVVVDGSGHLRGNWWVVHAAGRLGARCRCGLRWCRRVL